MKDLVTLDLEEFKEKFKIFVMQMFSYMDVGGDFTILQKRFLHLMEKKQEQRNISLKKQFLYQIDNLKNITKIIFKKYEKKEGFCFLMKNNIISTQKNCVQKYFN